MIKRVFDVVSSFIGLLLLLPLLIIVTFLVMVFIDKKFLFVQKRLGKDCRKFNIYKFKTMKDIYDSKGELLSDEYRITKLGNILRKTSIDELPELINVLKGDMSIVGPRPLLVEYKDLYTKEQLRRHEVLPGITGLAQIEGRNNLSFEDRFKMDIFYVDSHNMWLDIKIIFKTIFKVLLQRDINQEKSASCEKFSPRKLVIIGAGGHGKVVAEIAELLGDWAEIAFLDDNKTSVEDRYRVIGKIEDFSIYCDSDFVVALGNNRMRLALVEKLIKESINVVNLIHPKATISNHITMGVGNVIAANSVVNCDVEIGNACIINTGAQVDHDCILTSGVHVSPSATLCGGVKVGTCSWIGASSCIIEYKSIDNDVTVGAGSLIIKDISSSLKVCGVPGTIREIR